MDIPMFGWWATEVAQLRGRTGANASDERPLISDSTGWQSRGRSGPLDELRFTTPTSHSIVSKADVHRQS